MKIAAILLIIIATAFFGYSMCRIPSRTYRHIINKTLIVSGSTVAKRFEDLLSVGDAESIHRLMKALEQKGDIDIRETDKNIYIIGRETSCLKISTVTPMMDSEADISLISRLPSFIAHPSTTVFSSSNP